MDHAAGIAGLIKAIMSLKNQKIPPIVHFEKLNRNIDLSKSPVFINNRLLEWEPKSYPRICGISSFGLSGTNCHIILHEVPELEDAQCIHDGDESEVLTLSAKSEDTLKELIDRYREYIRLNPDIKLSDICYTANTGRGSYEYRLALIIEDKPDLEAKFTRILETGFNSMDDDGIYYCKHELLEGYKSNKVLDDKELCANRFKNNKIPELCHLYVEGTDIDWYEIYKGQNRRKVRIPVYPFKRTRCWIKPQYMLDHSNNSGSTAIKAELCKDAPSVKSKATGEIEGCFYDKDGMSKMFFESGWIHEDLQDNSEKLEAEAIILFRGDSFLSEGIVNRLGMEGIKVIEVEFGSAYEQVTDSKFVITGVETDYLRLFESIRGFKSLRILHLSTTNNHVITGMDDLEQAQKKGVYSLFHIIRILGSQKNYEDIQIVLISKYVNSVTGCEDTTNPHNATLFGLGKAIFLEYPWIKCKCIDIDEIIETDSLVSETRFAFKGIQVAYRKGKRYVEIVKRMNYEEFRCNTTSIKEGGVYVITGGTGRIGLEIGKYIASRAKVTIALVNRVPLLHRNQKGNIFTCEIDRELKNKLDSIEQIEKTGSKVICYCADISKENEVKAVIDDLSDRFGRVNGIVHCAAVGVGTAAYIERQDAVRLHEVLAPKVYGTWVVDKVTRNIDLDFFVMFSSAITTVGGVGAGSYIAANSYLDSFAVYRSKQNRKTLTINWPTWENTLESLNWNFDCNKQVFEVISTDDAVKVFGMLLNGNKCRVIVGRINLSSKILPFINRLPCKLADDILAEIFRPDDVIGKIEEANGKTERKTVVLYGRNDGNYSNTEQIIANIWGEVLGLDEIGLNENFFDLGGHSLLAVKFEVEMEKNNLSIVYDDVYKYCTIRELALYLDKKNS